ncbi:MAG: hypothetical protein OEZ58_17800 [Gammaproteobacteria bacterium]|nr:hypothetical protein [Gammaproteobacteria bacterium]MDH5730847.1 hypothetical protein [Gammaproteobacteria bacterium]
MKRLKLVCGFLLALTTGPTWALGFGDLAQAEAQKGFDGFAADFANALQYRAVAPAEPLGLLGIDIGAEVTVAQVLNVADYAAVVGGVTDKLKFTLIPRLHVHKGLPFGLDVGAMYMKIPKVDFGYWGGEIRYSFISGNLAIPAVAVRGTYSTIMGFDAADLSTMGLELTVSKGFLMLTPYAGAGMVKSNASTTAKIPVLNTAFKDYSETVTKWFVGFNFNMGLLNFAGEMDQTGEYRNYSAKLGFRF